MSILENLQHAVSQQNQLVYTENGDTAYRTSGSANLSFYGTAGAMRNNQYEALKLFFIALAEDYVTAVQNLLYLRDVRHGLGERDLFRLCWHNYCQFFPDDAARLIPAVIDCGRYDDLLTALHTPAEPAVIEHIQTQLQTDLAAAARGEPVSLLAKWLPSVNASGRSTKKTARYLAKKLGMTERTYRQTLSALRKNRILENNLREKDYTFAYSAVPSQAMHKYRQAFARNDQERYTQYIHNVSAGVEQIHAEAIYPYQIISESFPGMDDLQKQAMQVKWDEMKSRHKAEQTIVVRDGSGSMTCNKGLPILNATALAILYAELQSGPFRNSFITFSSDPEIVTFDDTDSLYDKLDKTFRCDDCTNTDIGKVYDLLYRTNQKAESAEEYVRRVVIISDMEFDQGTYNVPTYESMKQRFLAAGFPLPEIIYWNVCARNVHFAAPAGESNVKYVSGFSAAVLDVIMDHGSLDAEEMMRKTLAKYEVWTAGLTQN